MTTAGQQASGEQPGRTRAALGSGCHRPASMVKMDMGPSTLERLKDLLPQEPETPDPDLTPAGVLVPLFLKADEVQVLFTQRTLMVKDHRGQIAFPGGVRDPGDPHLLATALRETEEEIGLNPEAVKVLGTLPATNTITGYQITPFVGVIPHPYDFRPSSREVKRLLAFPVAEFSPPERWSSGPYTFQGRITRVCYWQNGQEVIWGATARILLHLLAHLGVYPIPGNHNATCLD